jgi:hypothetical protein
MYQRKGKEMKSLTALIIFTLIAACAAQAVVTIDANNLPAKDAFDSIAKQASVQVMVDTGVAGNVTAVLKDVSPDQAMDTVTKALKLEWRKIQFPVAADTVVTADKLKAVITALAALNVPGLSVADQATGKITVFAKAQASDLMSSVKLPDGQTLKTFYLVSKPGTDKPSAAVAAAAAVPGAVDPIASERLSKIAAMPAEDRSRYIQNEFAGEMQLAPAVRAQLWQDRMAAMRTAMQDPNMADQIRADMRAAGVRGFGGRRGGGNRGGQNNGN